MDTDSLIRLAERFLLAVFVLALLVNVIRFFWMEYQLYQRNRAEVLTARATAYYKHPEMAPVLAGYSSTYVFHITFHTDSGDILKLYMNADNYYCISEGDTGNLTWQGNRFWRFEKEE